MIRDRVLNHFPFSFQVKTEGLVEFKNVTFRYPFRRDVKVLRGFNLKIEPGKTVGLVGSSGCGKSTAVSLIERFYDVDSGSVVSRLSRKRECDAYRKPPNISPPEYKPPHV